MLVPCLESLGAVAGFRESELCDSWQHQTAADKDPFLQSDVSPFKLTWFFAPMLIPHNSLSRFIICKIPYQEMKKSFGQNF